MSKPRSLNSFNDYIAEQLLPDNDLYHVTIEDSVIRVDSFVEPFLISLSNVSLKTADDNAVITFKQVDVTADLPSLLFGKFALEDVIIHTPKLSLFRDRAGELRLQADNGIYLPASFLNLPETDGKGNSLPFETLTIRDANLSINDRYRDMKIKSDGASFYMEQHRKRYDIEFNLPLYVNDKAVHLQGKAVHSLDKKLSTISLELDKINPASICQLLNVCGDIPTLSIPLSGNLAIRLGGGQQLKEVAFDVSGENGTLSKPEFFAEEIPVDSVSVQGTVKDYGNDITLRSFDLTTDGMSLSGDANFQTKEDGDYLTLNASGRDFTVNNLGKYWPTPLAPLSREWVINSVSDGVVPKARISINMTPKDFAAEYFSKESISAQIEVRGATINYLEGFPKATKANGIIDFTGTTIDANTTNGNLLTGTNIPKARFFFSDLNADGTPMEIEVKLTAPAQDVLTIINPPRFDFLERVPVNTKEASGSVNADIKLAFDAFSGETSSSDEIDWGRVKYDIDSTFTNINGIIYDETFHITNSTGTLKANNESINAKLNGFINNAAADLSYKQNQGKAAHYSINAMVDTSQLIQFGLPEQKYISGMLAVKADMVERGKQTDVNATIDLAQAQVRIDPISYIKPELQPATLSIRTSQSDKGNLSINYNANKLKMQAHALVDFEKEVLKSLSAERITYGKSDVSFGYADLADGYRLSIKGKRLDMSESDQDDSDPFSFADFPAIQLSLDVGEVMMPENQFLYNVKGHIHCSSVRCDSADLYARLKENKQLRATIFRSNGNRQFRLQCNDAGALLRAIDITDTTYSGDLDIRGSYDDSKNGNPLDARLTITNFVEKDAPILGKVLNLSSLTGLLDTLSGKGIAFEKLSSDFVLLNDIITLKNLKMAGDSIGVVGKGSIDLAKEMIDLEGSLAPAYILNSIVGKIPLIGEMLAGGEGEGVFAVNFSIRGNMDDPDVLVNPLSALTPGFTRKFFNIFDAPSGEQTNHPKTLLDDMSKSPVAAQTKEVVPPKLAPSPKPVLKKTKPVNPFGSGDTIQN